MLPFALTIFSAAFLLFQVQPLIAKFILPWFGGGPAVWTTCMLFFQALLLAGYAYAHLSAHYLKPRIQAVCHLLLLFAALAALPIIPGAGWKPAPSLNPTGGILVLLTVCLGLPYFVLSSTGPLMQTWFSQMNPGRSPYRLYALSNLGSLLALLSYPFLIEPSFSRKTQATLWSSGLWVAVIFSALCAVLLWKRNPARATRLDKNKMTEETGSAPSRGRKTLWLCLAACASVLLLSVTTKICQDVAIIPFLWVLPLALYLLTFILCFDNPVWYFRGLFTVALIPTMAITCLALFGGKDFPLLVQIAIYSGVLFVCCMVCHGELYRLKPPPAWLTSYYLWIAAGGALGGVLVVLVSPVIFSSNLELHLGLWGCTLLLMIIFATDRTVLTIDGRDLPAWKCALAGVILLGVCLSLQVWYAERGTVSIARNFYGVLRVRQPPQGNDTGNFQILQSGEVTHGLQFLDPLRANRPTAYYHEKSGLGLALRCFPRQESRRIGVVGLGIGTIAAYTKRGDSVRFYEINPEVERMAKDSFTYLSNCSAQVEVILGDARLSLENEQPQQFDLLALDAFSSDAIPIHLLTKEAFDIYLRHLKSDGVIAVHLSNQHLDLAPPMESLASNCRLKMALISTKRTASEWWNFSSDWILLTTNDDFLKNELIQDALTKKKDSAPRPVWTDDYASLFHALRPLPQN